jgi:hypothetical protein
LDEKIFVTIKKTEYDFALYLQANGGDTVDGAQLLCQAESKRIADRAALEEARQKEQAEKEAKEKADQEAFTEWLDTTAETYMQNRDSRISVMQDIFKITEGYRRFYGEPATGKIAGAHRQHQ